MIEYTVRVDGDSQSWYLNGKRHREDGPAIIDGGRQEWWYINGKLHREDGPAIIDVDKQEWYLNGEKVTEKEVLNPIKELTVSEISDLLGYNVKIVK